ncbi:hypothetical protein [Pseudomonas jessenii]|uniref:hypothetical protein n=1 Tax=Pseudomonas jessenii TaxID=77298 RepID=UPI000FAEA331
MTIVNKIYNSGLAAPRKDNKIPWVVLSAIRDTSDVIMIIDASAAVGWFIFRNLSLFFEVVAANEKKAGAIK